MKRISETVQIGATFESTTLGMGATLLFGTFTAGMAYTAYQDDDIYAAFISVVGLAITGLATYNTVALYLAGDCDYSTGL